MMHLQNLNTMYNPNDYKEILDEMKAEDDIVIDIMSYNTLPKEDQKELMNPLQVSSVEEHFNPDNNIIISS